MCVCVCVAAAVLCCGSDVCLLVSADLCDSAQSAAALRRLLCLHHTVFDTGKYQSDPHSVVSARVLILMCVCVCVSERREHHGAGGSGPRRWREGEREPRVICV